MSFSETLISRAQEANRRFGLFSEGERVLVGFSGGADSLVLLCVMRSILGGAVHALHVNHMLRGAQADADEAFCRDFCAERDIPFSSVRLNVAEVSGGVAVEETARNMRYAALAEEARRIGAEKIALAHTASDNAETVIFNLSRGAGLAGLRGIPPKRPHMGLTVIRPLILCSRAEIEGYAAENGLPFCTDATNADVHYRRNYIRHKIIPLMKELNPAFEERACATAASLREDEDFISGEARRFIEENGAEPALVRLLALHCAVRKRVFAMAHARVSAESLEQKHFADIEALIKSAKNGARIILPGKTAALIKNGTLSFIREDELCRGEKKEAFLVPISEGRSDFDGFSVILCRRAEQSDLSLCKGASFTAKIFVMKQTAQNIYVRNRENGDKYFFGGMTRTLKKLLTGKTEAAKRTRPVFCDGAGIFWFPGFRVRDDVYGADGEKDLVLIYAEYGG
jgi:tRNA(Ile)-lysidine synthase